jgi:hypothetical protein
MDATTSAVSFQRLRRWAQVVRLAGMPSGTENAEKRSAMRLSPEDALAIFEDLLNKIQFGNEEVNEGYVRGDSLPRVTRGHEECCSHPVKWLLSCTTTK